MKQTAGVALLAALLASNSPGAAETTADPQVLWNGQGLSVTAERVPLRALLETVAARSGLEIHGLQYLHGQTSAEFTAQPLQAALKILLARNSYTFFERANPRPDAAKLAMVEILASPSASATALADNQAQSLARGERKGLREQALAPQAMTRHQALQELATQSPQVALELASDAMTSSDAARRAEAVQTLATLAQARATELLELALADKDSNVRRAALMSLAMRPAIDSLPYLLAALHDPAAEVSNLARTLLAQKGASY